MGHVPPPRDNVGDTHPDERLALHNTSVDEKVADAGACGQLHVPTGRTCTLPRRHRGSCSFVARDEVEQVLAEHPVTGGE